MPIVFADTTKSASIGFRRQSIDMSRYQSLVIGVILTLSVSSPQEVAAQELTASSKCVKPYSGSTSTFAGRLNLCLRPPTRGLYAVVPDKMCKEEDGIVLIEGFQLLLPKDNLRSSMTCRSLRYKLNGFSYRSIVNSSCLIAEGDDSLARRAVLPLMEMYNGRTQSDIAQVNSRQFQNNELPRFTWFMLQTRCVKRKTSPRYLYADICSNVEQRGTSSVHIEFLRDGGAYLNQTSCSCNVFSRAQQGANMLVARAVDVRLGGTSSRLYFSGKSGSRRLDGSEVLYWGADGDLIASREHLYVELQDLHRHALPSRVWVEITGINLTVNCGPANVPGGHRPLTGDSGGLGIGAIAGIIVALLILLLLVILAVKCVLTRRSKQVKDEYDISMGSHDDIQDRQSLQKQQSKDGKVVEIDSDQEVMYAPRRAAQQPVEESHQALLHETDGKDDDGDDAATQNNNTMGKSPPSPPPPPPEEMSHHDFLLSKQMSYIDEDEADFTPPPPISDDIYNHLNDHTKPDVVPGSIYDTSNSGNNIYSTTRSKIGHPANVEGYYDV